MFALLESIPLIFSVIIQETRVVSFLNALMSFLCQLKYLNYGIDFQFLPGIVDMTTAHIMITTLINQYNVSHGEVNFELNTAII